MEQNNEKHKRKRNKNIKNKLKHKEMKEFHLNVFYHTGTFARPRQKYFPLHITSVL